mmetsp:Transcript_1983/g.3891  ORF Transcript_1983/g.3891 Transcript_1983/m.3891 type:complete len:221 (-) Transcript_1983:784-1446(-)
MCCGRRTGACEATDRGIPEMRPKLVMEERCKTMASLAGEAETGRRRRRRWGRALCLGWGLLLELVIQQRREHLACLQHLEAPLHVERCQLDLLDPIGQQQQQWRERVLLFLVCDADGEACEGACKLAERKLLSAAVEDAVDDLRGVAAADDLEVLQQMQQLGSVDAARRLLVLLTLLLRLLVHAGGVRVEEQLQWLCYVLERLPYSGRHHRVEVPQRLQP